MGIAPNTLVHIFTGRMTDIEKRNRTFLIRLNDDEYEVIKKRAEKLNMRFAVYVRHIAVQDEMKCFDLAELREVTRPFRMIGNELKKTILMQEFSLFHFWAVQ